MADEAKLNFVKELLGYTDAQWETWKGDPRNPKIVENLGEIGKYKIVTSPAARPGSVQAGTFCVK